MENAFSDCTLSLMVIGRKKWFSEAEERHDHLEILMAIYWT
jgi:hypothetical protein